MRRIPSLLAFLTFTIAAAAAPQTRDRVRVALVRSPAAAPLYVALQAGFFASEGLDVVLDDVRGDSAVSTAVASGRAEIGFADLTARFYRDAAAHRFKLIASEATDQAGFPMNAFLISRKAHDKGFAGARDLPDRRIGVVNSGSGAYYGLFHVAARFHLDPGAIDAVVLGSANRAIAALARARIDAALLPYAVARRARRDGETLLRLGDLGQWQAAAVFTSDARIAQDRSVVQRFVRAYRRGAAEYAANFLAYDDGGDFIPGPSYQEYLDAIARQTRLSPQEIAATKTYCDPGANLDVPDIEEQVAFWQARGKLDPAVAAAQLVDRSFTAEKAAAR